MDYQTSLEVAQQLEVSKKYKLKNSLAVKNLAGFIHQYGVTDLPYLNKLAESLLVANVGKKEDINLELTPESLMYRDRLTEDLRPWAANLRKRYFKSEQVPFKDYASAISWMRKFDAWKKAVRTGKDTFDVPFKRTVVYYENGEEKSIASLLYSPLDRVIIASKKFTKELEIGLDWNSLVFYVLADITPWIPPIEMGVSGRWVTLPSGRNIKYFEADVKIREGFNLTYLKWLYGKLREKLQLARKKKLNASHLQLYLLVKQKGGAPKRKGTVVFWQTVTKEWNARHPKNKYATWKGIKIAYERTIKKLSNDSNTPLTMTIKLWD